MTSKELYVRLLGYTWPYWRLFVLAMIAMVVLAATEPAMPALMKPLLDGSFVEKDPTMIRLMPIALVVLFMVRSVATFASDVGLSWVANKVVMDLRIAMFDKLVTLPTAYYDSRSSGTIIAKLIYDVGNVSSAATSVLMVLVRDSLAVVGLLAWMFYLNWQLSLFAFAIAPIIALIVKAVSGRLRGLSHAQQNAIGHLLHVLEEAVQSNRVVKIFGGYAYEMSRFHDAANWVRRYLMKFKVTSAVNAPLVQLVTVVALAVIIYLASLQSARDEFTVGAFVSFFGAMALLFSPLKRLTKINEQLQAGLAAAESVFGLLDEDSEQDSGTLPLDSARGGLEFRGVGIRYGGSERHAVRGFNLSIEPGETIALVGASGSGKSTVANLVPRLYTPTEGVILLDGHDIRDIRLKDLRANIALVSQDVVLFNDTVAANIAYGAMLGASRERIAEAARAAHALEFIEDMAQGMDTLIGEDGVRLSGGQRQRLAIARAILKDAPVLIFDEATSALDTQSERYVQVALESLTHGRTTMIIAHRLSTIEKADRIVVMHRGRIVEMGDHASLVDAGGVYNSLYRAQTVEHSAETVEGA